MPRSTDITFGEAITSYRWANRLTQKEIADNVGISESYMSLLANGKRLPTIMCAQRIATALGISLSDLLQGVRIPV